MFFLRANGTFTKDYMLGHKQVSIHIIVLDYNGMKLESNNNKLSKKNPFGGWGIKQHISKLLIKEEVIRKI